MHSLSFSLFLLAVLFVTDASAVSEVDRLRSELESMDQRVHIDPLGVRAYLLVAESLISADDKSTRLWFYLRRAQAYNALFMYRNFERDIGRARALQDADVPASVRLWLDVYDGLIKTRQGELQRGVDILTVTAQRASQLKADRAYVFAVQELAYTRGLLQQYDESLQDLHLAYAVALQTKQPDLVAMVNDAYGGVYAYMQDYPRSLEYYQLALAEFERLGYKAQIASVLMGLASTYRYAGQPVLAVQYYNRYLESTRYATGKHNLFYGNYGLAMTYAEQDDCQLALPQIAKTLLLQGPIDYKAELFKQQARCEAARGQFGAADMALQRAADILNGMPELAGTTWVLDLEKIAAGIEHLRGNTGKAYALLQHYYQAYVQQMERSSSDRMNMLRADLENQGKDLQIALLKQQAQVSQLEVAAHRQENQQQRYLIVLSIAISLAILGWLLVQRRTNRHILTLSHQDSLSGLYNRRYTFGYMEKVIPQISVANGGLSIILLDIDDFKGINDRYGHPMGDLVIKRIASIGENSLRNRDIMGRIGGEEFLCVLPRATAAQTHQVAQRLLDAISAETFSCRDGTTFSTSISIGIANFDTTVANADRLYSMADTAMYRSKKAGKNRITTYQSD